VLELVWGSIARTFCKSKCDLRHIQPTINAMVNEIIKDTFTIKAGFMESHHDLNRNQAANNRLGVFSPVRPYLIPEYVAI
jgi:hypothetical protein